MVVHTKHAVPVASPAQTDGKPQATTPIPVMGMSGDPNHVPTAKGKRGRPKVTDKTAPHGRNEDGTAKAPYGLLDNGNPRVYPNKAATVANLDVSFLAAPIAVTEAVEAKTAPSRARDDMQQALDKVVKSLHTDWVRAGRPTVWTSKDPSVVKIPKAGYWLSIQEAVGVKAMLGKAAELHECRIKYGTPIAGTNETDKGGSDRRGQVLISFGALDKTNSAHEGTGQSA
jgi:hypothetical protein